MSPRKPLVLGLLLDRLLLVGDQQRSGLVQGDLGVLELVEADRRGLLGGGGEGARLLVVDEVLLGGQTDHRGGPGVVQRRHRRRLDAGLQRVDLGPQLGPLRLEHDGLVLELLETGFRLEERGRGIVGLPLRLGDRRHGLGRRLRVGLLVGRDGGRDGTRAREHGDGDGHRGQTTGETVPASIAVSDAFGKLPHRTSGAHRAMLRPSWASSQRDRHEDDDRVAGGQRSTRGRISS